MYTFVYVMAKLIFKYLPFNLFASTPHFGILGLKVEKVPNLKL